MSYDETLHVLRIPGSPSRPAAFGVIVTPFLHKPGSFPLRKLSTDRELTSLLERPFGFSGQQIEDILSAIRADGATSIHHVSVADDELRELGLR